MVLVRIMISQNCALLDFGSHRFTAAALVMLTLFRRGRIIHTATYFEDAREHSPVRDVATIMQYDTIAAHSSHGAWPTTDPWHHALCSQTETQTDAFSVY